MGLLAAALTVATGLGLTGVADAAVVCGQTITQSTTLTADVGPCSADGIVVGADNITLNLNGFRLFGTPATGDGAGVLVQSRTGVTVTRGTVSDFDGGVVILGGGNNTVSYATARDNIGASTGHQGIARTKYADGILVQGSSDNKILNNRAINNGWSSGIGLIPGDSDHPAIPPALTNNNLVQGNIVSNNVACRAGPFCDNDGIRVEPRAGSGCLTGTAICPGPGNRIIGNTVTGNGLDGIALFGFTTANVVSDNIVFNNGFNGAVPGDGIRVFGSGNQILRNSADGNLASGISVARRQPTVGSFPATNPNGRNNVITGNRARGNRGFDLWDSNRNPDCDNNTWKGNGAGTGLAACTLTP
ncbi:MAG: right-handed parallel beta-helix repeat-containing protein [Acidimicrobiales bacterium]